MDRRDFLKTAGIAGGAALISQFLSGQVAHAAKVADEPQADPLLEGVCDLHIHAAPDIKDRTVNERNYPAGQKQPDIRRYCSNRMYGLAMTGLIWCNRLCRASGVSALS